MAARTLAVEFLDRISVVSTIIAEYVSFPQVFDEEVE
jgi:hypothetical protein